jgi:hypothetical protein
MSNEAQAKVLEVNPIDAKREAYLAAKKAAQAEREAFIASLPKATNEQLGAMIVAYRQETDLPKDHEVTFKVTKEQKTDEVTVSYVDENGEARLESLSIKSAKKARRKALQDKNVRAKFRARSAKMDLVSVKYSENKKRVRQTEVYERKIS